MHLRTGRCSTCLAHNWKCDLVVTEADWARIDALKAKLRRELEAAEAAVTTAEEAQMVAHHQKMEALGREIRLRKQLRLLESRENDMLVREIASIEALEELERQEIEKTARPVGTEQAAVSAVEESSSQAPPDWYSSVDPSQVDWAVFLDPPMPADSLGLENLDFADENVQ